MKASIVESKVDYIPLPTEGGLSVFTGTIVLRHRSSIHSLSFAKLRTLISTSLGLDKIHIHLDEKIERAAAVVPAVAPAPVEVKNAPPPVEVKAAPVEERKEPTIDIAVPTAGENLAAMRKQPVKVPEPEVVIPVLEPAKPEPETKAEPKPEPVEAKNEKLRFGLQNAAVPPKSAPIAIPNATKLAPRRFGFTTPNLDIKK